MSGDSDKLKKRAAVAAAKTPVTVEEPFAVGPHGAYAYVLMLMCPTVWLGLIAFVVGVNGWVPDSWRNQAWPVAALGGALFLLSFAWCMIRYYFTRHMLEEGKLVLERGVFWRTSRTIPFNLVYNCTSTQSPLQVRFGCGTLQVKTADMQTIEVPWVIHPPETRDILLSERPRVVMWGQQ